MGLGCGHKETQPLWSRDFYSAPLLPRLQPVGDGRDLALKACCLAAPTCQVLSSRARCALSRELLSNPLKHIDLIPILQMGKPRLSELTQARVIDPDSVSPELRKAVRDGASSFHEPCEQPRLWGQFCDMKSRVQSGCPIRAWRGDCHLSNPAKPTALEVRFLEYPRGQGAHFCTYC